MLLLILIYRLQHPNNYFDDVNLQELISKQLINSIRNEVLNIIKNLGGRRGVWHVILFIPPPPPTPLP